jgi:DNA-binding transcriptional ArsR family regulator
MIMLAEEFDPIIHEPARFSIMALLAPAVPLEFQFIRNSVELSESALSKHLATLTRAGYIELNKQLMGRPRRTIVLLTDEGRVAFDRHVKALERIIATAKGIADPAYDSG